MADSDIDFNEVMKGVNKTSPDLQPEVLKRFVSAFVDFSLLIGVKTTIFFLFLQGSNSVGEDMDAVFQNAWFIVIHVLIGALYYMKDVFGARGPGKRILGLQVVNSRDNVLASPIRSTIRNFLIVIFPMEMIFILANPDRRIGDFFCGTKVLKVYAASGKKFHWVNYLISFFLAALFSVFLYFPLWFLSFHKQDEANIEVVIPVQQQEVEDSTFNYINYFKTEYDDYFESVFLTVKEEERLNIEGSFIMRKNMLFTREGDSLVEKIKSDFKNRLKGKPYTIKVSFVFAESETPSMRKIYLKQD